MTDVESLLLRQKDLVECFNKLLEYSGKLGHNIVTAEYLGNKYSEISVLWNEFDENNTELFPFKSDSQPYFKLNTFYSTRLLREKIYKTLQYKHARCLEKQGLISTIDTSEQEQIEGECKKKAEKMVSEAEKKGKLIIEEGNLTDLFALVEGKIIAETSIGEIHLTIDELRTQFAEWKAALTAVQQLNVGAYDRQKYAETHQKYMRISAQLHEAVNAANAPNGGIPSKSTAELPKIKIP